MAKKYARSFSKLSIEWFKLPREGTLGYIREFLDKLPQQYKNDYVRIEFGDAIEFLGWSYQGEHYKIYGFNSSGFVNEWTPASVPFQQDSRNVQLAPDEAILEIAERRGKKYGHVRIYAHTSMQNTRLLPPAHHADTEFAERIMEVLTLLITEPKKRKSVLIDTNKVLKHYRRPPITDADINTAATNGFIWPPDEYDLTNLEMTAEGETFFYNNKLSVLDLSPKRQLASLRRMGKV